MDELPEGLWAWMTLSEGEWVIVGAIIGGMHTPLIFALERIARSRPIRDIAESHALASGQIVRLVRFQADGFLETIDPRN
jgi:hypothetical protein